MRKTRSIIYVTLLATAGLLAALVSPLTVLYASIVLVSFLAMANKMNLYKMVMMMKKWAKNVSRLRFEVRAKLHTGYRDYTDSLEADPSHRNGRCSYAR